MGHMVSAKMGHHLCHSQTHIHTHHDPPNSNNGSRYFIYSEYGKREGSERREEREKEREEVRGGGKMRETNRGDRK